jgi:hypothetical protein
LLLQNNSLLAANTIMYMVRGQVANKCNFLTYSIALTYSDAAILQSCTDSLWSFHYSDKEEKSGNRIKTPKGWSVDIGGTLYALPSAEALFEGRLIYSDELYKLLGWRSRLLQEISTYEVFHQVAQTQRATINMIILNEFTSPTMKPPI